MKLKAALAVTHMRSSALKLMDHVSAKPRQTTISSEESQVREVENELTNALLQGDAGTLDRLYGADYVHTGPDGVLSGKSGRIAEFRSGMRQFTNLKRDDVLIHMHGMAAVVTDVDTVRGTLVAEYVRCECG